VVDPDQPAVHPGDKMKLDMMVDPVHADHDEGDDVDDEMPLEREQPVEKIRVGRRRCGKARFIVSP
jgi:hypothetical protein